jgi:hypothetical protein
MNRERERERESLSLMGRKERRRREVSWEGAGPGKLFIDPWGYGQMTIPDKQVTQPGISVIAA